jgi:RNA polymerase sigma-70 factor (ECF subfamily)
VNGDDARAWPARLQEDPRRFGEFVDQWRDRLRRMVDLRMHPALRARLDASDVVQEACAEAVERLPAWLAKPEMPLHLWLRFITGQKLVQLQRRHLDAGMRDAAREVPLGIGGAPEASAVALAGAIAESGVLSPSGVAMKAEKLERLRAALDSMKAEDREVLVLRHFEQLNNNDVAHLLGLSAPGASLRYMRAVKRLREIVRELSDSGR